MKNCCGIVARGRHTQVRGRRDRLHHVSEALAPLIALVDDEAHLRTTVAKALRREGCRVQAFPDGAEAWCEFERTLPDLAILDIIMPRMDGLELCRRIRGLSQTVPVMFLTSRDEEFDRVLGLELGADDYLCKPFSLRELAARVKVLLRRAGRREGDAAEDDERVRAGLLSLDTGRFTASWKEVARAAYRDRVPHPAFPGAAQRPRADAGAAPRGGVPPGLVHE